MNVCLQVIHIDEKSGEITLAAQLDYEKHKKFEILAVPLDGGEGIPVRKWIGWIIYGSQAFFTSPVGCYHRMKAVLIS